MEWGEKVVHTFPIGISPKVNIIAQLEFEFTCYDVTFYHISHCDIGFHHYSQDHSDPMG